MACILSTISLSVPAQDEIKWGKIPKEDLAMTVYEPDPEADAVVLEDIGEVVYDVRSSDRPVRIERHVRMKLLTQAAVEMYGDVSVEYYSRQQYEVLSNFRGQVYLPDGQEFEVKKEHMFKVVDDDTWSTESMVFPGLQVGAIIEYRYTLRSSDILNPVDWYFQREIPVRYCALTVEFPEWFQFVSLRQGQILPKHTFKEGRDVITYSEVSRQGTWNVSAAVSSGSIDFKVRYDTYEARDVPALEAEKHVTTMDDYYTRLRYQLQSINFPSSPVQPVMSSWSKVEDELLERDDFGKQYGAKRFGTAVLEFSGVAATEGGSQKERATLLFDALSSLLQWDNSYAFLSRKSVDNTLKERGGSSADLNLTLLAGLLQLDIEAYPVLTSTRTHGQVLELYPFISQFNHTMVLAMLDGQATFMDITGDYHPVGLPKSNALNYRGWLVRDGRSEWVNTVTDYSRTTQYFQLTCDASGTLEGTVQAKFTGYPSVRHRALFFSDPTAYSGAEAHTYSVSIEMNELTPQHAQDKNQPWSYTSRVRCTGTSTGDLIYVAPIFSKSFADNPFKAAERTVPVEFNYPVLEKWILDIVIPEGYTVESLPRSLKVETEGGGVTFTIRTGYTGNKVQIVLDFGIHALKYAPDQYLMLKTVFDEIQNITGEQIVLRKT